MENKKNQSEYKIKPKSPFISKRSKKLAERYSLKKSFSPEPSKISSIESPKEKISPKVVHIEYDEKQKFLVEKIAKKLIF